MNKTGLVVGVAAVAALAGCLDPDYRGRRNRPGAPDVSQRPATRTVQPADDVYAPSDVATVSVPAISEEAVQQPAPGTLDATPVATAPVTTVAPPPPPPPPVTTTYIVQPGDSLSKISKRFNIKIQAIKAANPKIKDDNIVKVGEKLLLPGQVEVEPVQAAPATLPPVKRYSGPTQTYVVKSGDTLGGIAKAHGTSAAQIRELNGMKNDIVRLGAKLKVPAKEAKPAAPAKDGVAKSGATKDKAASGKTAKSAAAAAEAAPGAGKEAAEPAPTAAEAPAAPEPADAAAAATPANDAAATPPPAGKQDYFLYKVKDGEDVTGIAITFDISPSEIRQLNGLGDDAQLAAGMELKLPLPAQQ